MVSIPGLWIDWDGLGFDDTTVEPKDLTQYLTNAKYSRGGSAQVTGGAQPGHAIFTVKNPAGLFDPDNDASPLFGLLKDGPPVWFGINEDGTLEDKAATVRGRFAGRVVEVAPLPVAGAGDSTPTAEIVCEDPLGWYSRIYVALADLCPPILPVPGEPSIEQYFTSTNSGGCEVGTWPLGSPGAGLTLIGILAQRANSVGDSSIVPIGYDVAPFSESCAGDLDIAGTDWTYVTHIASGNYPLTMAMRHPSIAGEPQVIRWGGSGAGLAGSSGPRSHQIAIAGLAGTVESEGVASGFGGSPGLVWTSPDVVASGPGYVVVGLSRSASGPADGSSAAYTMDARAPAVTLTQGYAYSGFAPNSCLAVLRVETADTYNIVLDMSATPRNPGNPWRWIYAFFPDA